VYFCRKVPRFRRKLPPCTYLPNNTVSFPQDHNPRKLNLAPAVRKEDEKETWNISRKFYAFYAGKFNICRYCVHWQEYRNYFPTIFGCCLLGLNYEAGENTYEGHFIRNALQNKKGVLWRGNGSLLVRQSYWSIPGTACFEQDLCNPISTIFIRNKTQLFKII
jgi:hypothetical protein